MTNYNERLGDILLDFACDVEDANKLGDDAVRHLNIKRREAKQAITSLTKELVAEAKPYNEQGEIDIDNPAYNDGYYSGAYSAIEKFEENLLKALEEL